MRLLALLLLVSTVAAAGCSCVPPPGITRGPECPPTRHACLREPLFDLGRGMTIEASYISRGMNRAAECATGPRVCVPVDGRPLQGAEATTPPLTPDDYRRN